ncbi:MAG TPA: response regulator [Allosphingosinicella sp.]|nr:response regulator [Allosphingosinicella sp.]
MLSILIVEDEPLFAATLKHLVELNPLYSVTALADDRVSALAAVAERRPDLALVDLQLAHGNTGFAVASKLGDLGIPCLFTTGKAPDFPMPDLALGCLVKPFSEDDLVRALKAAEDIVRGRQRVRPSRPGNLRLYAEEAAAAEAAPLGPVPVPARSNARRTLRARAGRLWRAAQRSLSFG